MDAAWADRMENDKHSRHTWMLSTHIWVIALILEGVTPGAFKACSDWSCVANSSIAAMIRDRSAPDATRGERQHGRQRGDV